MIAIYKRKEKFWFKYLFKVEEGIDIDNAFDISNFNLYREDNRHEVKKAKDGLPISLWESYSAFANCYGGVIILSVRENEDGSWVTTGLQNSAKIRKEFWDTVNNSTKVSVNLLREEDVEIYEYDNDYLCSYCS